MRPVYHGRFRPLGDARAGIKTCDRNQEPRARALSRDGSRERSLSREAGTPGRRAYERAREDTKPEVRNSAGHEKGLLPFRNGNPYPAK